jgi:hypothetical protein
MEPSSIGMAKSPLWVHAEEDCDDEAAMLIRKGWMGCTLTRILRSLHILKFPPESTNSPESSVKPMTCAVVEMLDRKGASVEDIV